MLWQVSFNGRKAGAIGITYPITDTVEADSEEQARLKHSPAVHAHLRTPESRRCPKCPDLSPRAAGAIQARSNAHEITSSFSISPLTPALSPEYREPAEKVGASTDCRSGL